MNKHAMDAVVRGAEEVIDPAFTHKGHTEEWVYYIDLDTLDLSSGFNCVLAQLSPLLVGDHTTTNESPFAHSVDHLEAARDMNSLVPKSATEYEYCINWIQYFGFYDCYGKYTNSDLTEAWTSYIEGRRDEAA